jgi:hypothetical protein
VKNRGRKKRRRSSRACGARNSASFSRSLPI